MLYGVDTRTLDRHQGNKLLDTEIDFWRRVAKKSRKEKIRNLEMKEIMNTQHRIIEVIEERQ